MAERATTFEGLQVKARVAQECQDDRPDEPFELTAGDSLSDSRMAQSIVNDLLGLEERPLALRMAEDDAEQAILREYKARGMAATTEEMPAIIVGSEAVTEHWDRHRVAQSSKADGSADATVQALVAEHEAMGGTIYLSEVGGEIHGLYTSIVRGEHHRRGGAVYQALQDETLRTALDRYLRISGRIHRFSGEPQPDAALLAAE